ncbi:alcohol dehydrogenase catalytic domain-containing protein [Streptomyces sp. NPDC005474]|uniref:zinc-dependent alcohol dehydrogenase n=1 Tax=Streptomyces sp. NPDC005474 TaxID=3154878 RepID=UPI003454D89E
MNSAVLTEYGRIEYRSTPVPAADQEELLVRVLATGVCGSDLATYRGAHPYKTAPVVLGHELCGVVERAAGGFAVGDLVCAAAYAHCESCEPCAQGLTNLCRDKRNLCHLGWEGSFAEYVTLRPHMTFALPPGLDPELGALVEPLSIGLHAIRLAGPARGRTMRVIGSGSIGLSCLIAARRLGFTRITCTDVGQEKGERALALGADAYADVLAPAGPPAEADVVVVAAGHPDALDEAVGAVRAGGTVIVVSFFDGPVPLAANALVGREVTVIGSSLSTAADFRTVISWLAAGEIDPRPMVTHRFALADTAEAMSLMAEGKPTTGKIILTPRGDA